MTCYWAASAMMKLSGGERTWPNFKKGRLCLKQQKPRRVHQFQTWTQHCPLRPRWDTTQWIWVNSRATSLSFGSHMRRREGERSSQTAEKPQPGTITRDKELLAHRIRVRQVRKGINKTNLRRDPMQSTGKWTAHVSKWHDRVGNPGVLND